MIFSKVKIWLIASAGIALSVMWAVIGFLRRRNAALETENTQLSGQNDHLTDVLEADIEIDEQTDIYLADVNKEIKDKGYTSELSEPNKDDE